ncbi:uncharacterized protein BX663DRAFT_508315 [Cokeromyces recurvatus]|uniref:uncharacterized protein n=1 Tax=Cokeromyces recurvatus TaxID=90255 RepID=UPI00221ED047|nr:uncharacterized protein BX663DRAFT_508315 [Cokeromyces recurvatus]KAI7903350.1 hypothetical protein BX663DRAFT_508315 [Cokeromyces recurvatus]
MTTNYTSNNSTTTDEYKQQNDQYWKIIEQQRMIIKTLQGSLAQLTNENEMLTKRNKELKNLIPASTSFNCTTNVVHPLTEISQASETPALPPRSPYRNSHYPVNDSQKRPPVLKLVMSNHYRISNSNKDASENTTSPGVYPHQTSSIPSSPNSQASSGGSCVLNSDKAGLEIDPSTNRNVRRSSLPPNEYLNSLNNNNNTNNNTTTINNNNNNADINNNNNNNNNTSTTLPQHDLAGTLSCPHTLSKITTRKDSLPKNFDASLLKNSTEPSTSIHSGFQHQETNEKLMVDNSNILTNLSNVYIKIISSNVDTDKKGLEAFSFLIGILQKDDGTEIWKIEKTLADLVRLDKNLKEQNPNTVSNLKNLPDKSLFLSHAPVKVQERKNMVDAYLQHAIALNCTDTHLLCEFLSSDKIYHLPITLANDIRIKSGYLTKKGKNFGGWKSRYFVLDNTGILKYYDSKNGVFLGAISLPNSYVMSYYSQHDSSSHDVNNNFRHAFVILEPKSNGTISKHTFCADSDDDRDTWIDALRHYTKQLDMIEDTLMDDIHHLAIEPSLSTESFKSTSTSSHVLRKRPSIDHILNYFQNTNSNSRRQSSSNTPLTSPKAMISPVDSIHDMTEENITTTEDNKKVKHRMSRKTFWPKRMFGSTSSTTSHESLSATPTSPQGGVPNDTSSSSSSSSAPQQNYLYTQFMSDYEETRGENQVFGVPLENVVSISKSPELCGLPAIVHRCIEYLETNGALVEEGIYRLSGSTATVKALKKKFNEFGDVKLLADKEEHDVHTITGLLKMWLRELPENILTESLLGDFLQIVRLENNQQDIVYEIGRLVSLLPIANYTLLKALCAHLIRIVEHSDKNKMTLRNISIVFSATLAIPSSVFNMLIENFDYIFWTGHYDRNENITEDTIKIYMQEVSDDHYYIRENDIYFKVNTTNEVAEFKKQMNNASLETTFPCDNINSIYMK